MDFSDPDGRELYFTKQRGAPGFDRQIGQRFISPKNRQCGPQASTVVQRVVDASPEQRMSDEIIVCLDGSSLAEKFLPWRAAGARQLC
jgi:hypothetical protein